MTTDTFQAQPAQLHSPLRRSTSDRLVGGVAAGVAHYFDVEVTLVRLAFVLLVFVGGFGVPLYVASWLLIPEEGRDQSVLSELISPARQA
jgi:phage shock protein PspC (stress-responsive transcriptional regulator)